MGVFSKPLDPHHARQTELYRRFSAQNPRRNTEAQPTDLTDYFETATNIERSHHNSYKALLLKQKVAQNPSAFKRTHPSSGKQSQSRHSIIAASRLDLHKQSCSSLFTATGVTATGGENSTVALRQIMNSRAFLSAHRRSAQLLSANSRRSKSLSKNEDLLEKFKSQRPQSSVSGVTSVVPRVETTELNQADGVTIKLMN